MKVYPQYILPLTILPRTHTWIISTHSPAPWPSALVQHPSCRNELGLQDHYQGSFEGRFPAFQGSFPDLCHSAVVVMMQLFLLWAHLIRTFFTIPQNQKRNWKGIGNRTSYGAPNTKRMLQQIWKVNLSINKARYSKSCINMHVLYKYQRQYKTD